MAQFPTVLIDTSHPALPSVVIDDHNGGRIATEHLLSLGHERIAFIGEPERNPFGFVSSRYRQEGYASALADAGIEFDRRYVKHGPHVRTAARQLAVELFAMSDPPTAVVAASDVQALGVLEAARLVRQVGAARRVRDRLRRHRSRLVQRADDGAPAARDVGSSVARRSSPARSPPGSGRSRSSRSWHSSWSCAAPPAPRHGRRGRRATVVTGTRW